MRGAEFIISVFLISAIADFAQSRGRIPGVRMGFSQGEHGRRQSSGNSNPFGSHVVIHRGGCALGLAEIPGSAFPESSVKRPPYCDAKEIDHDTNHNGKRPVSFRFGCGLGADRSGPLVI